MHYIDDKISVSITRVNELVPTGGYMLKIKPNNNSVSFSWKHSSNRYSGVLPASVPKTMTTQRSDLIAN